MSPKQRIHDTLVSWIEAHHVPGGYGGKARMPAPDATEGGPWGYLKTCLVEGSVYFRFLENPMFEKTWIRAISDIATERVVAILPPGAVLANATSSETSFETSEEARRAIEQGAVVAIRTDVDGEPEHLILSPPDAQAAVYTFGAKGHRKAADSVADFVAEEVARIRAKMPEQIRFGTKESGPAVGWLFGAPPGLTEEEWPRHSRGGFPLAHGFTVELPEAYRVRKNAVGVPYVALSFFHPGDAEANGYEEPEAVAEIFDDATADAPDDAFLAAVHAHARARTQSPSKERLLHVFQDGLDQTHAVVFHTEASYRSARAQFPSERGPTDLADVYPSLEDDESPLYAVSASERREVSLGRPLHPMQGDATVVPMGYFVMELACDVGGANFADGTAQYDLESGAFDWSC
jgi:hypothetical protein